MGTRVFISYSHDSAEHMRRVRALADRLRANGIEAWIDQYVQDPEEGWVRWMRHQVREADKVLLVFTKTYQHRYRDNDENGKDLGSSLEGPMVTSTLYEGEGRGAKFWPLVFREKDAQFIPVELRPLNRYRVDIPKDYEALLRALHGEPRIIGPPVGPKPDFLQDAASELLEAEASNASPLPPADALSRKLRVFLCHSSQDKTPVRGLYQRLIDDGVEAWFDEENLIPGQTWEAEIQDAVRASDVVVVCLSRSSVTKEGYVQKEIWYALEVAKEKPEGTIFLIPTRLEECEVPRRLKDKHWVDLFKDPGYDRLLKALKIRAEALGVIAPAPFQPRSFSELLRAAARGNAVLILGRLSEERKLLLDALRAELRKPEYNYFPILFDFQPSPEYSTLEMIKMLASMARFVIADLTNARSVIMELKAIIPTFPSVAVHLLIKKSALEYGMLDSIRLYRSVVETMYVYEDEKEVIASIRENIIAPAEAKVEELRRLIRSAAR